LAGGVVPGADLRVWPLGPLAPGAPVVVGPRSADDEAVGRARRALRVLVTAGGTVAAGADVALGPDFRSARVDGGAGDRRDATLAALPVPGVDLGPPLGLLVALFGPTATRPLGAAARAAIEAGRWPVLRFAAAASDVLGPEQLVALLDLRAPDGVDPFPDGLPSVVGGHLARVLAPVPRPRRLALLTDLWSRVCAAGAVRQRVARLRAARTRVSRLDEMRARYRREGEAMVLEHLHGTFGPDVTLAEAALWRPPPWYWSRRTDGLLHDALAATVLARVAVSAVDHGLDRALADHRHEIEACVRELVEGEAPGWGQRRQGLPPSPASYVRDLQHIDDARFLTPRLGRAGDYAEMMLYAVRTFLDENATSPPEALVEWSGRHLGPWRAAVGYLSPDRLATWEQQPMWSPGSATLSARLRASPDDPAAVETIGDLLWFAELADALARLRGHEAAVTHYEWGAPWFDADPATVTEPLVPRFDSVARAAAATAQLVDLGGTVPRTSSWGDLVTGLLDSAAVAAALTGSFVVPDSVAATDATVVPGTDVRVEVARNGRQLAEWSDYMGNCIAGQHYVDAATAGRAALLALRDSDGRIVANVELRPSTHGWRVDEFRARFNDDPPATLASRVEAWAATLVRAAPATTDLAPPEPPAPRPRTAARSRPPSRASLVAEPLGARAATALAAPSSVDAAAVLAGLADHVAVVSRLPSADLASLDAGLPPRSLRDGPAPRLGPAGGRGVARRPRSGDPAPVFPVRAGRPPAEVGAVSRDALTALRRVSPATLTRACRLALVSPSGLADLWRASAVRPLAAAVADLPGADRLAPLLVDAPLPGSLRPLARRPHIAPARTADLVALRVRAALGILLRGDAPELAAAVRAAPDAGLVRAAALAVTTWGPTTLATAPVAPRGRVRLPGYPVSSLRDAGWQAAWPDARELGADDDVFWDHIAAHGLLLPASWLTGGGWPALWSRTTTH